MTQADLERELDAILPASDDAPCDSCGTNVCADGDTLCEHCRAEIDGEYGDLPGAEG